LRRSHAAWAGLALAAFAYGLWHAVTSGYGRTDEAWFLQVVGRTLAGDVLYRDVFFGATPLSVWATAGLCGVFGVEVLVLKALLSACFAAKVVLCCGIARRFLGATGFPLLLALSLAAYAAPDPTSAYSAFAEVAALGCLWSALAWPSAGRRAALAGGVLAGLCFASKQNVGLFVAAALLAAIRLRAGGREGWRGVGLAGAAFLATLAVTIIPVLLSGGLPRLLDYGFLGKGAYAASGVSYLGKVRDLLEGVGAPHLEPWHVYRGLLLLLPPLVLATLAWTWLRASSQRGTVLTVALFLVALLGNAFPRADVSHLVYAMSALALAAGMVWRRMGPAPRTFTARALWTAALLWLLAGAGYRAAGPIPAVLAGRLFPTDVRHFRGAFIDEPRAADARRDTAVLERQASRDPRTFVVSPCAGFHYLTTGLSNPTPFDFPYVTALGRGGERRLIDDLAAGRIRSIAVDEKRGPRLYPRGLIGFVEENLREVAREAGWVIYTSPSGR